MLSIMARETAKLLCDVETMMQIWFANSQSRQFNPFLTLQAEEIVMLSSLACGAAETPGEMQFQLVMYTL